MKQITRVKQSCTFLMRKVNRGGTLTWTQILPMDTWGSPFLLYRIHPLFQLGSYTPIRHLLLLMQSSFAQSCETPDVNTSAPTNTPTVLIGDLFPAITIPTRAPTDTPTAMPTDATQPPSKAPTQLPTTKQPTEPSVAGSTIAPSKAPTKSPITAQPTKLPVAASTNAPSKEPTQLLTTAQPTKLPVAAPTNFKRT